MLHKNKSVFAARPAYFFGNFYGCLPFVRLLTYQQTILWFELATEVLKKCHIFSRFIQKLIFLRPKGPEKDDLARFLLLTV